MRHTRFPSLLALRLAAAAVAVAGSAHASSSLPADEELHAVRHAAARGHVRVVEAAVERFAGHPLEPYPRYWLLAARLGEAQPGEIRAFLDRYGDSALADVLRRDWLRALGSAGRWELFREELPRLVSDDPEIACFSFQERLARADPAVTAEVRAVFTSGRQAPVACDAPFATLASAGEISEAQVWDRIRNLLAANELREARRANALLPARERIAEKSLRAAAADPAAYLRREKAATLSPAARETAVFALSRLARSNAEDAAARLEGLAERLGPEASAFAWGQVALQAALSHDPRALEWYAAAATAPLTDTQVAWRARAALRAGDWKQVLDAIDALSPSEAREATWRYWRARALHALGHAEPANALLKGLAREHHFYGILAAEELDLVQPPVWDGWRPGPKDLERVGAVPGVQRALALYRLQYHQEAFREWVWALRGFDDRQLLAAAELARQAGERDRAVNAADRTVQLHDFSQRYPIPHREAIAAAASQWGTDEAMMYAIIRQESRFRTEARSRVGAAGLMQLMPATARWVARQIKLHPFRLDMLAQPEVNVSMGSYYFARVLEDLGHPMLAAAAYNAGPGRARRWRDAGPLDAAIYAETIPFTETREYVKKVFANAWFYSHRLTGTLPRMRELLGAVPGRDPQTASTSPVSSIP